MFYDNGKVFMIDHRAEHYHTMLLNGQAKVVFAK
jgi:hypothetical protein